LIGEVQVFKNPEKKKIIRRNPANYTYLNQIWTLFKLRQNNSTTLDALRSAVFKAAERKQRISKGFLKGPTSFTIMQQSTVTQGNGSIKHQIPTSVLYIRIVDEPYIYDPVCRGMN